MSRDSRKFGQEGHSGPGKHHELHRFAETLNVLPRVEFRQIVVTDEIVEFRTGIAFVKNAHGIDRERGTLALDFARIHLEAWFLCDCGGQHLTPRFRRSGGTVELVRRNARRKEDHLVQSQALHGIAGQDEVSIVNGIEAAAVEANLYIWFRHVVVY